MINYTAIVDYDAGNTESVINALSFIGQKVKLTRDIEDFKSADRIIFPGVGAYHDAMCRLKEYELCDTIIEMAHSGKPFLGICLGMQLLFDSSTETIGAGEGVKEVKGLGILPGRIKRFDDSVDYKIPHIGWNSVRKENKSTLLTGIEDNSHFYFVHSYYLIADCLGDVSGVTEYGMSFHSSVEHNNIFGCQFHPEKSGECGLKLLRNFCSIK